MSLITPILTVVCACAVPAARMTASAAKLRQFFIVLLPFENAGNRHIHSNSKVIVELFGIGVQFGVGETFDDLAVLHDIIAIRDGGGEPKVLLYQQNRETLRFQRADGLADLLNYDGGKPFGRLVE